MIDPRLTCASPAPRDATRIRAVITPAPPDDPEVAAVLVSAAARPRAAATTGSALAGFGSAGPNKVKCGHKEANTGPVIPPDAPQLVDAVRRRARRAVVETGGRFRVDPDGLQQTAQQRLRCEVRIDPAGLVIDSQDDCARRDLKLVRPPVWQPALALARRGEMKDRFIDGAVGGGLCGQVRGDAQLASPGARHVADNQRRQHQNPQDDQQRKTALSAILVAGNAKHGIRNRSGSTNREVLSAATLA
jgi:hypothetical protein